MKKNAIIIVQIKIGVFPITKERKNDKWFTIDVGRYCFDC